MKILTRYIAREIAAPAVVALMLVGFVAAANEIREKSKFINLAYIALRDVAELIVLFLPTLVAYVVPLAYMMGILLAFGRLAQNNEITAMKAAGVPLKRIVLPILVVGALLSGVSFLLQDWVQPLAVARANRLIFRELPMRVTLDVLPAGVMHTFRDWRVYIGRKDPATRTLYDIKLFESQREGARMFYADSARVIEAGGITTLLMEEGYVIPSEEAVAPLTFSRLEKRVPSMPEPDIPSARQLLTLRGLLREERNIAADYAEHRWTSTERELHRMRLEIADRIALPLAALAVAFLAAPLAVRSQRSGRTYSFAIGLGIALLYYVTKFLLEPQSLKPLQDTVLLAMAPNILLMIAGAWAVWRVDRI